MIDQSLREIYMVLNVSHTFIKYLLSDSVLYAEKKKLNNYKYVYIIQIAIKIAGKNHNLRQADNTSLMAESEEELKSLLMKVKKESKKTGLKLSIQNTKIMAFGPVTSWQIDG